MNITTGELAPQFQFVTGNGDIMRLSDFQGKYVVLYFYPRDLTPSCTAQACDFRDHFEEFTLLNVVIIGISTDPMKTHGKFIKKYNLPFLLVSDEDHAISELYGAWKLKSMYGKTYMGIERSSFLINPKGILIHEWRKVKVPGHISNILKYLKDVIA
ncbi:peroxiredoxin [Gordoniibacillus kamchatkensis]|uniref:thioredoxin-dependent peroxiredoxin n=1 Tax=Gordoniibacillus kamchatkensis TaxID=1590651 RepID=A0ABR5AF93_9BACL|nr:thioredoxin-dependent thiol peroxidase [Paenibacillus sp. VKM B-2647]KIL39679.1 peroxiredoxin [Paenibacillus sp. VKM B-2647]